MADATVSTSRRGKLFALSEHYLRIEYILSAFWAMFWTLNGLDKFFDGTIIPDISKAPIGWFGVNREEKFCMYFERLHLSADLALFLLYAFAILEIIIGLLFLYIFLRSIRTGIIHRMAYRLSIMVFFAFCTGDILFGDRMELWEHGTFMVLTLMTYRFYLDAASERRDVVGGDMAIADLNDDGQISEEELEIYLANLRAKRKKREEEEG